MSKEHNGDLKALDQRFCKALIAKEKKAHDELNRRLAGGRHSFKAMIRRRENAVMEGHSLLELIYRKSEEGVFPVSVAAMRALKGYYPEHESAMWKALRYDAVNDRGPRLDLSAEDEMLSQAWRPLFDSQIDGEELLKWAYEGRFPKDLPSP